MRRSALPSLALLSLAVLACVHDRSRPPDEASDRQRAEAAACFGGTWPAWLDDGALADSSRLDRWGAAAMNPDDSFRDSTVAASPPPPGRRPSDASSASRYATILEERRAFEQRCALLRAAGPGPGLVPVR